MSSHILRNTATTTTTTSTTSTTTTTTTPTTTTTTTPSSLPLVPSHNNNNNNSNNYPKTFRRPLRKNNNDNINNNNNNNNRHTTNTTTTKPRTAASTTATMVFMCHSSVLAYTLFTVCGIYGIMKVIGLTHVSMMLMGDDATAAAAGGLTGGMLDAVKIRMMDTPISPQDKIIAFFRTHYQCDTTPFQNNNNHNHNIENTTVPAWLKQMVIQIGVQKGGTKAVNTFLQDSPHFISRCTLEKAQKELNFFNYNMSSSPLIMSSISTSTTSNTAMGEAEGMEPTTNASLILLQQQQQQNSFFSIMRQSSSSLSSSSSSTPQIIHQHQLQLEYTTLIQESCPRAVERLELYPNKYFLDDSPLYMQDSDSIPPYLNCLVPFSKLLAILRNPTDRAFSHYNFYLERNWCTELSFEQWIDVNILDLHQAGVLTARDSYEEFMAWRHYNTIHRRDRKCRTFVTRGLYAIQLLHYYLGLQAAGRPPTDLLVMHSAHMKGQRRQRAYNNIMAALGKKAHALGTKLKEDGGVFHKTEYKAKMNQTLRLKLEHFYKPYNRRLYGMLGWKPVWG